MNISNPEVILDARAALAEGPCWAGGSLYWVNIHAGELHRWNPQEQHDHTWSLGEPLGCVAPRQKGGLVLALKSGFTLVDELPMQVGKSADIRRLGNPEPQFPGNRFNDGKCDPAGRLLAGTMDDAEVEACGSLYSLSPAGSVSRLLTGLRISNGLAWSPDYRTFYFIDTPTRMVMAYDYDLASGGIANPNPVISIPPAMGFPDGMTSDMEGKLWIALWEGAALTRWDPATGKLLESIPVPALNVSSCAFGGDDLIDLYVTTACKGMTADQLSRYPLSGSIFRIHTSMQGMPTFEFAG